MNRQISAAEQQELLTLYVIREIGRCSRGSPFVPVHIDAKTSQGKMQGIRLRINNMLRKKFIWYSNIHVEDDQLFHQLVSGGDTLHDIPWFNHNNHFFWLTYVGSEVYPTIDARIEEIERPLLEAQKKYEATLKKKKQKEKRQSAPREPWTRSHKLSLAAVIISAITVGAAYYFWSHSPPPSELEDSPNSVIHTPSHSPEG